MIKNSSVGNVKNVNMIKHSSSDEGLINQQLECRKSQKFDLINISGVEDIESVDMIKNSIVETVESVNLINQLLGNKKYRKC